MINIQNDKHHYIQKPKNKMTIDDPFFHIIMKMIYISYEHFNV